MKAVVCSWVRSRSSWKLNPVLARARRTSAWARSAWATSSMASIRLRTISPVCSATPLGGLARCGSRPPGGRSGTGGRWRGSTSRPPRRAGALPGRPPAHFLQDLEVVVGQRAGDAQHPGQLRAGHGPGDEQAEDLPAGGFGGGLDLLDAFKEVLIFHRGTCPSTGWGNPGLIGDIEFLGMEKMGEVDFQSVLKFQYHLTVIPD